MRRPNSIVWVVALLSGAFMCDLVVAQAVSKSPAVLGLTWTEPADGGVVVSQVEPGSAAAKAGIRIGDVVSSVNDIRMARAADLDAALKGIKPGQKAVISVLRGDEVLRLALLGPESKIGFFGAFVQLDRGHIRIVEVPPGTPAAAAGLKAADVLLSVGGHVPTTLDGLVEYSGRLVSAMKPGEKVALKVGRDQAEFTAAVEIPAPAPGRPPASATANTLRPVVLGITVKQQGSQVTVSQVIDSGPAWKAGIRPNDALAIIGNERVTSYANLMAAIKSFQVGDQVPLQLMRGSQALSVTVVPINNDTSIPDVVLDSSEEVGDIAVEVKQLKVRVAELTRIVDELSREVQTLKQR